MEKNIYDASVVTSQPSQGIIQINQTNVMSNPMQPRGTGRMWSSDLYGCCDDMAICLCVTFVPCHSCMLAADMNESCCFPCFSLGSRLAMRALLRGRHNIQGNLCNDCLVVTCCCPCAECQVAREVKNIKSGMAVP